MANFQQYFYTTPHNWGYGTYSLYHPAYFYSSASRSPQQQIPFSRELPPINTSMFTSSLHAFPSLMRNGSMILERLANSKELTYQLMDAAQKSDQAQVDRLIRSLGVPSEVKTSFTPEGVSFYLSLDVQGTDCCHLRMSLRW